MFKCTFCFFISISFFSINCFSQHFGKLEISAESKVTKLFERYLEENKKNQTIEGFRVQIHFGNDREKAKDIKTKFLTLYPQIEAYESYQQPNFRIRTGDFRTRYEALKFQKLIAVNFPSSYIVSDNIKLPILNSSSKQE
jgi:hypothetical protein